MSRARPSKKRLNFCAQPTAHTTSARKTCRFYAACVLEALAYMHARGVAYRDLKVGLSSIASRFVGDGSKLMLVLVFLVSLTDQRTVRGHGSRSAICKQLWYPFLTRCSIVAVPRDNDAKLGIALGLNLRPTIALNLHNSTSLCSGLATAVAESTVG